MKKYCCLFLFVVFGIPLLPQQPSAQKSAPTAQSKSSSDKARVHSPSGDSPDREEVLKLLALLKVRDTIKITIDATKGQLGLVRTNGTKRGLLQRGPGEFSPVGAANVRIKFAVDSNRATALTVHDPDLVLTARRVTD